MRKTTKVKKHFPFIQIIIFLLLVIPSCLLFYVLRKESVPAKKSITQVPVSTKVAFSAQGAFLGASFKDQNYEELLSIEKKVDKHFALVGIYQSWGSNNNQFNLEWARAVADHESVPLITWEPWTPVSGFDRSEDKVNQKAYRLVNITKGTFDPYITTYAREVRNYGKPVIIRFAHEMNGNWYSWGSTFNTPEEYIAAWKHVHDIFVKEGARNVSWLWAPNALYDDPHVPFSDDITKFYPGDEYVDIVGFSAFNWAGQYKQNVWTNPAQLYAPTVAVLSTFNKPLVIAETASAESQDKRKAQWLSLLVDYIKDNPQIKGIMWFNVEDNGINWQIDSSSSSLDGFKKSFDEYFIQRINVDRPQKKSQTPV